MVHCNTSALRCTKSRQTVATNRSKFDKSRGQIYEIQGQLWETNVYKDFLTKI